jgi:response regulator RpfG family c-di-GMP phosphodiesterase
MKARVLFVGADNVVAEYSARLGAEFDIATAPGGLEGLAAIKQASSYAVVVADQQMSGMCGLAFLGHVREIAPLSTRLLIVAEGDHREAAEAVEQGTVFHFLTVPCSDALLIQALEMAAHQHVLERAEAELLEKTLIGSLNVLTELLALSEPVAFGRARKLRDLVHEAVRQLHYPRPWELELAALLSSIGLLTLPDELRARIHAGHRLTPDEHNAIERVPCIGAGLLHKIPRLEAVAELVHSAQQRYDGSGFPQDGRVGNAIPLGARILKILADRQGLEESGMTRSDAVQLMRVRTGSYDPHVLNLLHPLVETSHPALSAPSHVRAPLSGNGRPHTRNQPQSVAQLPWTAVRFHDLATGQVLMSDVLAEDGSLLLCAGTVITYPLLEVLKNCATRKGIQEPIRIAQPH